MGIRAIITALPYKLKADFEMAVFNEHLAQGICILTENSAVPAAYYTKGDSGRMLVKTPSQILHPKPKKEIVPGQATDNIKAKLR